MVNDLHFLLALLKPPAPTASVEVLVELGLSYEKVRDRIEGGRLPSFEIQRASTLG
jgi:hypothetical protein